MITLPADYTVPTDIKVGDTFDEVVTLRLDEDGYATPVAIAGVDIPEKEKEDDDMEEDMGEGIGAIVMKGMRPGMKGEA